MNLQNKWALITGASSGMGKEYADILASKGMNIVLTARRLELLESLKKELESKYQITVELISQDLSKENAAQELFNFTLTKNIQIEVLINNAGFGLNSDFKNQPIDRIKDMIQLNITSLVELTKVFSDDMLKRSSGYILQIASIAGYTAIPTYAVYGATKSFVMNFGQALNIELAGSGVSVSTLNPGTTRTEFFDVSGHNMNDIQKKTMMDARVVSEIGIKGMLKRKSIIVPGIMNTLTVILIKFCSRNFIAKSAYKLMRDH